MQLALLAQLIGALVGDIAPLFNMGSTGQQSAVAQSQGVGGAVAGVSAVATQDLLAPTLPWGASCGGPMPGSSVAQDSTSPRTAGDIATPV